MRNLLKAAVIAAGLACLASPVRAETQWDVSIPWAPTEFHTIDAQNFAKAVSAATKGQVKMVVHPGGALGIRANESLRAVEDGTVTMAEFAAFQNVGDVPILGLESIPFLVDNYDELRKLHKYLRPVWDQELAKRGQKILYVVPWPSQSFFTKRQISKVEDMKGVRMRTYDANTTEMAQRLGMVALQMNNADVVPAMATGKVDAVMTSGTTAASQKYWEFVKYVYNTNHLWSSNIMSVNLDAWNKLPPDQRAAIEKVAAEMEPGFWAISEAENGKRMEELQAHGMVIEPISPSFRAELQKATANMADQFVKKVGGKSAEILSQYRQ